VLCERELDLDLAEALPPRETLTSPVNIVVAPNIIVTPVIGASIAVQVLTIGSESIATLIQNVHT